ncbi:MAG: 23S rRNA (adenine(2503)-C(2))-methyltransferase RlmN [Gemmatimonadota bacterium]|nr:23S rRNA (adenine(2503)-C(2))-methyltransferase RlmN [Gemmatimonadota bacterium]
MPDRPSLLGLTPPELREAVAAHFRERGQPAYRAGQVEEWIFRGNARAFGEMSNLPLAEREALGERFRLDEPAADAVSESADGTVKHLWALRGGEVVESVLIPTRDRLTLCISSQAGCALKCRFCATGWSGFGRQLTAAEIAGQYRASARWAAEHGRGRVTNVVFMGMGEPLANRKAVFPALSILNAGYGVGARRITVSTVGVIPGIAALAERPEQFRLALSLHAPVTELRAELIPLEKRYPLPRLMEALEAFNRKGGRRITFEYTMIRDVNDDPGLLPRLAELAARVQAFVNLIPFNPIPYVEWRPSRRRRIRAFREGLEAAGVSVAVREPRGRDIEAACGQLRASRRGSSVARAYAGSPWKSRPSTESGGAPGRQGATKGE